MSLTPDQEKAARAPGSVAVTAGAGTGKTFMLAERYLHHVQTDGFSPLEIVAVTFTDKAADELRSRIRAKLAEAVTNETILAEVDAAQISTIHSLAARICRDFYYLTEIPAEFSIMDETESPMWLVDKIEVALGELSDEFFHEFGYSWFSSAIATLLSDPLAAEAAFAVPTDEWSDALDMERERRLNMLLELPEWQDARGILPSYRGTDGDILEGARVDAINAQIDIEARTNLAPALSILTKLPAHRGQAKNWTDGGKEAVQQCLRALKSVAPTFSDIASLEMGEPDRELARKVPLLREAFKAVRKSLTAAKFAERVLDYNDLEVHALKILKHPIAVQHYAERWKALMIDEFQDTNPVQAEILTRLSGGTILTIVGDEKQSIYGFRGADVGVFGRFRETIKKGGGSAEELALSFRAHQELIDKTNTIFEPVLKDLHQALEADRSEVGSPQPHITCHVVEQAEEAKAEKQRVVEARHIAGQIKKLIADKLPVHNRHTKKWRPAEYRDIAILSRAWAPLDIYADALAAEGIPAVHAGGGSLLETREAKDGYALLSFLADPFDDIALVAVLRSPFFAVSDRTLFEFAGSLPKDTSWWPVLREESEQLRCEYEVLDALLRARTRNSPEMLLRMADKLTGYTAVIANLPHGIRRLADWRGLLSLLRTLEKTGRSDVFGVARYFKRLIESETEIPRPPVDAGNAVQLMTIHKAKGLEWPIVVVPDLARKNNTGSEKILIDRELGVAFKPDTTNPDADEPAICKLIKSKIKLREEEEARRVLYVALTRARDKVVLTSTCEEGFSIDLLRPGLEAAGVIDEPIAYSAELTIPPAPGEPAAFPLPKLEILAPVPINLTSVPVSSLGDYEQCPQMFKFKVVDGHPGLGEGSPAGRWIGNMAHKALELDTDNVADLLRWAPGAGPEHAAEALRLAANFRSETAFAPVRDGLVAKEVPLSYEFNGVTLKGMADLVGDDFVVDYKTDREADPPAHRLQLWAYARALGKSSAHIAYLRHNLLHTFGGEELQSLEETAIRITSGIRQGLFAATPSEETCGKCHYSELCHMRHIKVS